MNLLFALTRMPLCSSQTWFTMPSTVLLLMLQNGKGVAQWIQRYSHHLIVFLVACLSKIWHTGPPADSCFWYAQIDYLGWYYEAKFHLTSPFVEGTVLTENFNKGTSWLHIDLSVHITSNYHSCRRLSMSDFWQASLQLKTRSDGGCISAFLELLPSVDDLVDQAWDEHNVFYKK